MVLRLQLQSLIQVLVVLYRKSLVLNLVILNCFLLSPSLTSLLFHNLRIIFGEKIAALLEIVVAHSLTTKWILKLIHGVALSQILEHHIVLLSFRPSILVVHVYHLRRSISLPRGNQTVRRRWRWINIVHLSLWWGQFIRVRALRWRPLRTSSWIRVIEPAVVLRVMIGFVLACCYKLPLHLWVCHAPTFRILIERTSGKIWRLGLVHHGAHYVAHLRMIHILVFKYRLVLSLLHRLVDWQLLPSRIALKLLSVTHLSSVILVILDILCVKVLGLRTVVEHVRVKIFKFSDLLFHWFPSVMNLYLSLNLILMTICLLVLL